MPRLHVRRLLVFECSRCHNRFQDPGSLDWVQPFEPIVLTSNQIEIFLKRVVEPAEFCIYEEAPFGILFMDMDNWLAEHGPHGLVMKLEKTE